MRRRRTGKDESEATLNLTPTIDVVFLLLIFFIATIRLPKPEANIRAYLPKEERADASARAKVEDPETEKVDRIWIALRIGRASGITELLLNGRRLPGRLRQLNGALKAMKADRGAGTQEEESKEEIVLDVADEVPYRYVVSTLDVCTRHGFSNVSFNMPKQGAPGTR